MMQSLNAFAFFLLVGFVTAVLSADTSSNSSIAITSPTTAANETSSSKATTVFPESVEPVNNDDPNGGAETVQATRTPQSSEATTIQPSLVHKIPSAPTTSKTVSELHSRNNETKSSTSAMSEKKGGADGAAVRANAGFAIFSVIALVVCGTFS